MSDAVTVTRVVCGDDGCVEGQPQSYDDFTLTFARQAEPTADRHFRIVSDDGVVVHIDEQYFA